MYDDELGLTPGIHLQCTPSLHTLATYVLYAWGSSGHRFPLCDRTFVAEITSFSISVLWRCCQFSLPWRESRDHCMANIYILVQQTTRLWCSTRTMQDGCDPGVEPGGSEDDTGILIVGFLWWQSTCPGWAAWRHIIIHASISRFLAISML